MKLNDGGYSSGQYTPTRLREMAANIAERLPTIMEETGANAVVVSGKSGVSLAFATSILIDFPIVVVRKRGENSHGNMIEGETGRIMTRYLILDDFISSGDTVGRIVTLINEYADVRTEMPPACVGCVMHKQSAEQADGVRRFVGYPVYGIA